MLDRDEYVEQAYFFQALGERLPENRPLQELLDQVREELLATTKLPIAVKFLLDELKHSGVLAPAMERLRHYFTPFQTYVIAEAESDRGRLDMRVGIEVLRREATYRSGNPTPPGTFLYQFETICRNRLKYDPGLRAVADDPIYDKYWREWILTVRRQIGIVDFADLLYVRTEHYWGQQALRGGPAEPPDKPALFGEKEGRIALANRRKDPLYLFAALQRHLGYPAAPRPKPVDDKEQLLPQIHRRLERLEVRLKLLEEEERGGIDLTKLYAPPPSADDRAR